MKEQSLFDLLVFHLSKSLSHLTLSAVNRKACVQTRNVYIDNKRMPIILHTCTIQNRYLLRI